MQILSIILLQIFTFTINKIINKKKWFNFIVYAILCNMLELFSLSDTNLRCNKEYKSSIVSFPVKLNILNPASPSI